MLPVARNRLPSQLLTVECVTDIRLAALAVFAAGFCFHRYIFQYPLIALLSYPIYFEW